MQLFAEAGRKQPGVPSQDEGVCSIVSLTLEAGGQPAATCDWSYMPQSWRESVFAGFDVGSGESWRHQLCMANNWNLENLSFRIREWS